ncbi:aspartic proteinase precursor [Basidiobolus ranarum]|uniref:Aspartic proteinase n=1 Tax=Basidiobolus ranarum TaxID=34480 RepID=A0ABR2VWS3_9FUNG
MKLSIFALCLVALAEADPVMLVLKLNKFVSEHLHTRTVNVSLKPINPNKRLTSRLANQIKNLRVKYGQFAGELPLENENDVAYYGDVVIGTPGQTFSLIFEPGSSDFWAPAVACTSNASLNHRNFDPSKSSTFTPANGNFSIQYGTGSLTGTTGHDTVDVGGLKITNQTIGLSTQEAEFFTNTIADGILGLGFRQISEINAPPPFYNMVSEKLIDEPIFSFWFGKYPSGGELTFGGVNNDRYSGEFQYAPVIREGYWEVALQGVSVGNRTLRITSNGAAIDTGTSLIVMPDSEANAINRYIGATPLGAQGLYSIPCTGDFPKVTLKFGGVNYTLGSEEYVLQDTDTCISAFGSSGISQPLWIVGDAFLRKYYTSYDLGQKRVGFALAK